MAEVQADRELAEVESRYRCLRASLADYHYHVRVQNGRVTEKIHGTNCEVITGYLPEEYSVTRRTR